MTKKTTIAIVEDNSDLRKSLQTILSLSERFNEILTFGSAEDFINSLKSNRYDYVLMDITLPNKDGIWAIEKTKEEAPNTLTIIVSLHDDDSFIFRGICAGASGYLSKPIHEATLLKAIDDVSKGGSALSPFIASRVLAIFKEQNAPADNDYDLSEREKEVLAHLVEGHGFKAIADKMNLSLFTIRAHIRNIYKKLHVHSKSQAVSKALREGFYIK